MIHLSSPIRLHLHHLRIGDRNDHCHYQNPRDFLNFENDFYQRVQFGVVGENHNRDDAAEDGRSLDAALQCGYYLELCSKYCWQKHYSIRADLNATLLAAISLFLRATWLRVGAGDGAVGGNADDDDDEAVVAATGEDDVAAGAEAYPASYPSVSWTRTPVETHSEWLHGPVMPASPSPAFVAAAVKILDFSLSDIAAVAST